MPTYTRKHYIQIGNLLKTQTMQVQDEWMRVFKADNPRFDEGRFRKHIGRI